MRLRSRWHAISWPSWMNDLRYRMRVMPTDRLLILLLWLLALPASALQNQLHGHSSPYLAMHGDDPVAWQDWSPSILELARKEGKLIFISRVQAVKFN